MGDMLVALNETPVPTILVVGGILFIFIAVGGQFGAKVASDKVKRGYAAIIGVGLLFGGIALYVAGSTDSLGSVAGTADISPRASTDTAVAPSLAASRTVVTDPSLTPTSVAVQSTSGPVPQEVRWGPVDRREAGICINGCLEFIPWVMIEGEVLQKLLPQVSEVPVGSTVELREHEGRQDWIVQIVGPSGGEIGNVWFGCNPFENWSYDGLVRVGTPDVPVVVWATFQRYSDGSYRRQ